jgi:hypothetical protein
MPNLIQARRVLGGGTAPFLLDALTVSAAYSTRKLRTAYTGSAFRLRESGGDTELDIGFASNGDLNTAAAATHIGGNSGFIVTWYDQSGNGYDVSNATAAQQPTYVASGVNGKPVLRFDGAGDYLERASVDVPTVFGSNQGTIVFSQKQNAAGAQNCSVFINEAGTPPQVGVLASYDDQLYFDFGTFDGNGRVNAAQPGSWDDNWHVVEAYRATGGTQEIIADGASVVSASRSSTNATESGTLRIGGVSFAGLNGDLAELIVFASDIGASVRSTLRTALGTYAGLSL